MTHFIAGFSGLTQIHGGETKKIAAKIPGAMHYASATGLADYDDVANEIIRRRDEITRISLFGLSNGAISCLRIQERLARHGIPVDYIGIIDLAFGLKPKVHSNVKRVDEFWSEFARLRFMPDFKGVHNFHDLDAIEGRDVGHSESEHLPFVQESIIKAITDNETQEKEKNMNSLALPEFDSVLDDFDAKWAAFMNPDNEVESDRLWYEAFFKQVRQNIIKPLNQDQVNGIKTMLFVWREFFNDQPIEFFADTAGQSLRETGGRMTAIRETFAKTEASVVARLNRFWDSGRARQFGVRRRYWDHDGIGRPYGRGILQYTLRENYTKGEKLLRDRYGLIVDLDSDYDLALDPLVSAILAFAGMQDGIFRGNRKQSDYLRNGTYDFVNARDIVNGDKNNRTATGKTIGQEIAEDSRAFLRAVQAAEKASPGWISRKLDLAVMRPEIKDLEPSQANSVLKDMSDADLFNVIVSATAEIEMATLEIRRRNQIMEITSTPAITQEIPKGNNMLDKLPFDGSKTVLGFIAIALVAILEGPLNFPVPDYLEQMLWAWTGVGGAHKVDKLIRAYEAFKNS